MNVTPIQKPVRCSVCFGKFMRNHEPQRAVDAAGNVRWTHKSCKAFLERQRSGVWPARAVMPDKDE